MDPCRNQQDKYVQARVPAGVISHPCMNTLPAPEVRFTRATGGLNGDFCHAVNNTLAAVQTAVVSLGVECRLNYHALSWSNFDY